MTPLKIPKKPPRIIFDAPKPIECTKELINLMAIDEKIKTKTKIITKQIIYFMENSTSKGSITATLDVR
jgi:argonaute-like protein implicated in RNA metabolism and viral defense